MIVPNTDRLVNVAVRHPINGPSQPMHRSFYRLLICIELTEFICLKFKLIVKYIRTIGLLLLMTVKTAVIHSLLSLPTGQQHM